MSTPLFTIVQPTALGTEDELPFVHAVAVARRTGARLVSVHANDDDDSIDQLPQAESLLRRWGLEGESMVHERLIHRCCDDPIDTVLDALERTHPDLVMTGTQQRTGWRRWIADSGAEAIALNAPVPTLVFPEGGAGVVDAKGNVQVERLVVPVGNEAMAKRAIERARWLMDVMKLEDVELMLLFVGKWSERPKVDVPEDDRWTVRQHATSGQLTEEIVARGGAGCLIVMATEGHDSLGDALLGSHTDDVLRHAKCPVLVCPS